MLLYRPPAVAGKFYPDEPAKLRLQITKLVDRVPRTELHGKVKGIITPHAGYLYSGFTAAHAFASLRGEKFETVVVVSPSHFEFFPGVSVYPGEAYATHLWRVAEAPFIDVCVPEELPAMPDLEAVEKGLSDTFRDLGRKSCPRQQPDQGLRSR